MKQTYLLETITPVHIGSGETLNHINGYFANGRWHYIDLDKVLAHPNVNLNALTSEMSQRDFRWKQYLQRQNMNPSDLSVYSPLCAQSPETTDIREAIKSIGHRPYIPGSSIKGAMRTMLLSDMINNDENKELFNESAAHLNRELEKGSRGSPRKDTPAKQIEADAFGKDPNHDILRALQVGDTEPLASQKLAIEMAWTVTLNNNNQLVQKVDNGTEYKNFVEVIQGKQQLTFSLKIDEWLFREREKEVLKFSELQENMLKEITDVCNFEASVLMQSEQIFYEDYGLTEIANFYDSLIGLNNRLQEEGAFMMQIGWGTGYHANTVTSSFIDRDDAPIDMMRLRKRFQLGSSRSQRGQYDEREFPKTRRILYRGQNPIAPPGWVKISPVKES